MKKAGLFIVCLLLISILPIISAADDVPGLGSGEVPVAGQIAQGQEQYEQYTTAENKTQYLKTEWNKILVKHKYLGPVVTVIDSILTFLNPFFKAVLGVDYSFSWVFIFSILIWLILFFFLNPIMSQVLNNGITGGISAFAITSIIGLSGVIKIAGNFLALVITQTWIAWIAFFAAVIFVFLSEKIGKMFKAKIKKAKEEEEKRKTTEAGKVIQAGAEAVKEEYKDE